VAALDDLFALTFRDSPIGMAIIDEHGAIVDSNAALSVIVGRESVEIIGSHLAHFAHSDDAERSTELLAHLVAGELPYFQLQVRLINKVGDTVWTRVTLTDAGEDGPVRFIVQVENITEVRRAKDLLERRALYDHLTGLANRSLLLDRLTHSLDVHAGRTTTVAAIFLDLDHFKIVNESLGHEAGDVLLAEISQRIQNSVRPGDTVARLGGDEFVIVLENITSLAAAKGMLAVITEAVQVPFDVEGHEVVPTVSAGLAMAEPHITAEALVRNADIASYSAKRAGRARVEVFTAELPNDALNKLSIEAELRAAIRGGELVVHYQPVVDLATRSVVAFEALVRWQHPTRGLLMPDTFIDICEEANLVVPLGAYVLKEACAFVSRNPSFTGRVFVNASTRQIGAADLARVLTAALRESGVAPARIGLEITESGMLLASHSARADMQRIRDIGVDLILDDFGTGYSALSSVLQSPVAGLKLAREFTLRLGDRSIGDRISTTMAMLTRSLNMYGVIEGLETEAQYAIARQHGWSLGQGYLFGYPQAEADIEFDEDGRVRVGDRVSAQQ